MAFAALPRYQRLTRKAEALIASVYLSGTNTRRVKRALFGLFRGAVSKDVVSRAWRKVKVDWDAWCSRGLADEDIVRLILDGTVIKTRTGPQGHQHLGSRGYRGAPGWPEGLAFDREYGRRKPGGVAPVPRRP